MTANTGVNAKPAPARSLWWQVHHWCGLKLSLLMVFVLLTGTLATISQEIDWVINPALRASTQGGSLASWGDWFDAAQRALPGGKIEEVAAPVARGYAVEVSGDDAEGTARIVYLDPRTAHVQGIGSEWTARRALRQVHRHLMLPGVVGLPIVASLSIPLMVLLVTAIPVYKKWWRGFLRWPRPMTRAGQGRRYAGDLHRLGGLWSLWFVALVALTGLWYLAEWAGARAPDVLSPPAAASAGTPNGHTVDKLADITRKTMPDLAITAIVVKKNGIRFEGQSTALLVRNHANAVQFDGPTRTTITAVRGETLSIHQRISEAADPLHFGNWGGLASRIVWFVFGLLLTLLATTGALIYTLRLQREMRWTITMGLWRGMGIAAVPCALLVAAGLIGLARLLL